MGGHGRTVKDLVAGLYNRAAPAYDQSGPAVFSAFGRRLVDLVGLTSGTQVLDLAAGRGAVLFAAAPRVGAEGRVIGIDLSEGMVQATAADIARQGVRNADMVLMDAEKLAFPDDSFAAVTCGFAIFYLRPDRVFHEAYRVLHPGGKMGLSLANGTDERWQWYNRLLLDYDSRYHFLVDLASGAQGDQFEASLVQEGFVNVRVIRAELEFIYKDEDEWWSALWSHGARSPLERMETAVLEKFRADVYARLRGIKQPDGLHQGWPIRFIVATKPI